MKLLLVPGAAVLLAAMFQMPATPPMKMGLWESITVMSMKMANAPANMPPMGSPRTTVTRSCLTPENYARNFYNNPQQKDCKRTNEAWTGSKVSFDIACPARNASGHFEMTFAGAEAGHGTMHMEVNRSEHPITMDMTYDTHFVGADCGSVTPGEPQIIR